MALEAGQLEAIVVLARKLMYKRPVTFHLANKHLIFQIGTTNLRLRLKDNKTPTTQLL
jgi:urease accessory protein UreE